ncbi:MAG: hypothetical protein AAGH67_08510 [Cyanobacteria bacterium P01_H01_bin.162]
MKTGSSFVLIATNCIRLFALKQRHPSGSLPVTLADGPDLAPDPWQALPTGVFNSALEQGA